MSVVDPPTLCFSLILRDRRNDVETPFWVDVDVEDLEERGEERVVGLAYFAFRRLWRLLGVYLGGRKERNQAMQVRKARVTRSYREDRVMRLSLLVCGL